MLSPLHWPHQPQYFREPCKPRHITKLPFQLGPASSQVASTASQFTNSSLAHPHPYRHPPVLLQSHLRAPAARTERPSRCLSATLRRPGMSTIPSLLPISFQSSRATMDWLSILSNADFWRRRTEGELAINIRKATSIEETAPKRKHVRSCIVYTWDHKSSSAFWAGMKVSVQFTSLRFHMDYCAGAAALLSSTLLSSLQL